MRAIISVVAALLICSVVTPLAEANDTDDVRAAVNDLYAKLNAADADGFIEYMLPDGYTEFDASGKEIFKIDQEYVRNGFASGIKADLKVEELEVRTFNDAAIVTGYRVGSITMPGQEPKKRSLCLSMMWTRNGSKWKLVHVHLSPHSP